MDIIIDIIEDEIFNYGQSVLKILLKDRTTKKNIIWATDDYQEIGINYKVGLIAFKIRTIKNFRFFIIGIIKNVVIIFQIRLNAKSHT